MQSQEEKLSLFIKAIGDYAEKQRLRILYEMDEQSGVELNRAEKEALSDAYRMIQHETSDVRGSITRELSARELAGRRRLFERRAEIENKVFEEAADRLRSFAKSSGYADYFRRAATTVRRTFADAPDGVVFRLRETDRAQEAVIRAAYGSECTFETDDSIGLGGLVALNDKLGRSLDLTLDARLEDQREWFEQEAALSVSTREG